MSCKYKRFENTDNVHPWCWITGCECQFLKEPHDMLCPILEAYPNVTLDVKTQDEIPITDEINNQ